MRLDDSRESDNVEDRRGSGIGSGGLGIGTIALVLVASYFLGVDPSTLLGFVSQAPLQTEHAVSAHRPPADDAMAKFVSKVLADTEDTWHAEFRTIGKEYQEPKLVLFSHSTPTACGTGDAAMGPFYCPLDRKVYIDLAFYRDLKERFHAPGEFAEAYVIAHEVGHHVQNLLGVESKVRDAMQRSSPARANALLVRLELQADCYAGVWAYHAQNERKVLEPGDVEEAINAAEAVGDDRLQKQAQGYVVPDSFTHGTSAQRARWFQTGFASGRPQVCDTFNASQL